MRFADDMAKMNQESAHKASEKWRSGKNEEKSEEQAQKSQTENDVPLKSKLKVGRERGRISVKCQS